MLLTGVRFPSPAPFFSLAFAPGIRPLAPHRPPDRSVQLDGLIVTELKAKEGSEHL